MISIIIPVKDVNFDYYLNCVTSIINQDYKDFEVIIKHTGPQDEFNRIKNITSDNRFKYLTRPDTCFANAANQAMEVSCGDLVTLFCHDDAYLPGSLAEVNKQIDEHLGYFGFLRYFVDGNEVGACYKPNPTIEDMKIQNYIPQPACFFKRQVYEEIGKFDESFFLCWDYDYWIRIMKKYQPKTILRPLAQYNLNQNSISRKYEDKMSGEIRAVKEKHFNE